MLAKELKIKTLFRQRAFIEEQLSKASDVRGDGNPVYTYTGYVYPENQEYFSDQGFYVQRLDSEQIRATFLGRPAYFFRPKDGISLNEVEMKEAENYKVPSMDKIHDMAEGASDELLKTLLSLREIKHPISQEDYE